MHGIYFEIETIKYERLILLLNWASESKTYNNKGHN